MVLLILTVITSKKTFRYSSNFSYLLDIDSLNFEPWESWQPFFLSDTTFIDTLNGDRQCHIAIWWFIHSITDIFSISPVINNSGSSLDNIQIISENSLYHSHDMTLQVPLFQICLN